MDGEGAQKVKSFITDHPELKMSRDYLQELAWDLMGDSEYYDFRVCETVTVTFLPCDVFAAEIE
jgi:hypothetical protein